MEDAFLSIYDAKNSPIGFIPKNVVIKRDDLTLHAGNIDFFLPNIAVQDHDSSISHTIQQWITESKQIFHDRQEYTKNFHFVSKWIEQHGAIKISTILSLLPKDQSLIWQKYASRGMKKIINDNNSFFRDRISISKNWLTNEEILHERWRSDIDIVDPQQMQILTQLIDVITMIDHNTNQ